MSVARKWIADRRRVATRRRRPMVEGLEGRTLLSVSVSEAPGQISATLSSNPLGSSPESLGRFAVGSDGNEWFADNTQSAPTVDRLTSTGVLTRFSAASTGSVVDITAGPDGNLWALVETDSNVATAGNPDQVTLTVDEVTTSGAVTSYAVPGVVATLNVGDDRPPAPRITAGGDRRLWFTDGFNIGRIDGSGTINLYPTGATEPAGAITSGSDGNLWFTNGGSINSSGIVDQSVGAIGRISVGGVVTEFPASALPAQPTYALQPSSIVSGPGNNLWFTDGTTIGRVDTGGTVVAYQGPQSGGAEDITVGPDGELWFTVAPPHGSVTTYLQGDTTDFFSVLGRLDASNNGMLTEVGLPEPVSAVGLGADGDLTAVGLNNDGPTGTEDPNNNYSTGSGVYDVSLNSSDAPVSITPKTVTLIGPADQAGIIATFTDGFASAPASAFSAVISGPEGPVGITAYIQADPKGGFDVYASGQLTSLTLTIYDRVTPGYLGSTTVAIPFTDAYQPLLTNSPDFGATAQVTVAYPVNGSPNTGVDGVGETQVLATFVSATPISTATNFFGSVDWGDGSSPTTGIVATQAKKTANTFDGTLEYVYNFVAGHAYPSTPGYHVVTATLTDNNGHTVVASDLIAVDAPALSVQAVPIVLGSNLTLTNAVLATFSAPYVPAGSGSSTFAATINWNDGTATAAAAIVQRNGQVFEVVGSHTFAKAGGYVVSIAITQSGQPSTSLITTAITPNPAIATYINNAYNLVLGHAADASTIAALTPELETGLVPLTQFAASLVDSPQAVADRVTNIFTTIYGQAPDAGTIASVSASIDAGLTDEQAKAFLYASAQYDTKEGGTNTDFLQGLYEGVLGRPIDSQALYNYLAELQAGTITRTQIAYTTLTSVEADQDLVTGDYQSVLGRAPTSTELASGIKALQSGGTDESLMIMLVGSGEYFGKA